MSNFVFDLVVSLRHFEMCSVVFLQRCFLATCSQHLYDINITIVNYHSVKPARFDGYRRCITFFIKINSNITEMISNLIDSEPHDNSTSSRDEITGEDSENGWGAGETINIRLIKKFPPSYIEDSIKLRKLSSETEFDWWCNHLIKLVGVTVTYKCKYYVSFVKSE